jgi:hypothetical protein
MALLNGSGLRVWDADTVPWNTVTIVCTANIHCIGDDSAWIDPGVNCTYSQHEEITASATQSFTYNRETLNLETLTTGASKFAVARGMSDAGEGAVVPPFFRTVFSLLCGDAGQGIAGFSDAQGQTMSVTRTVTYARVGPNPDGICAPLPTNINTTTAYAFGPNLGIQQSGTPFAIIGSVATWIPPDNSAMSDVVDTDFTTPRILTLEDLKLGGAINFGSTKSYHYENPDSSYWSTWTSAFSIALTTS